MVNFQSIIGNTVFAQLAYFDSLSAIDSGPSRTALANIRIVTVLTQAIYARLVFTVVYDDLATISSEAIWA